MFYAAEVSTYNDLTNLSMLQIVWPYHYKASNMPVYIAFVNGVDYCIFEPMNLADPNDYKKFYSHKFNKAALRYELAVSIFENKLIAMNGHFLASNNDAAFSKGDLLSKPSSCEKVIGDKGYKGCPQVLTPSGYDNAQL